MKFFIANGGIYPKGAVQPPNAVFCTHKGNVRTRNEDSGGIFQAKDGLILILCDGMGGMGNGADASSITCNLIVSYLQKLAGLSAAVKMEVLPHLVRIASEAVQQQCGRGGSTLTALFIPNEEGPDGKTGIVLHVGDSRMYASLRGVAYLVTRDHAAANGMLLSGVGAGGAEIVDCFAYPIEKGMRLLLCSDGLTNMVDEDMIGYDLINLQLDKCARSLQQRALNNGGRDNVTMCLYDA